MSKQLGQFLQEQQEPFTLELYLLERGQFRSKHLISDGDFRCCSRNFSSTNFLKRSASCGEKKRRKVIPNCSKIVKSVFNKLVTISHNQKIKNLANDQQHNSTSKNTNIIADDDDKFSSASNTTVFHSCSDSSDAEGADNSSSPPQAADDNFLPEKQVFEDRIRLRLEILEESKQLSPVSVLEETESSSGDDDDDSPDVKKQECVKANKQEEFSTPSSHESQYSKNKKAIQQSRQLLFDCVKEVVENQKNKDPRKEEFQRILGAEQLWELVLQNIWLWSQDSIHETNVNHLMHFEMLNSFEQLSDVEEKREIGKVVGDLIFVDTSNEIVLDMFNYSSSR